MLALDLDPDATSQRIDYQTDGDRVTAILTITFPDGSAQVFTASADAAELNSVRSVLAAPEIGYALSPRAAFRHDARDFRVDPYEIGAMAEAGAMPGAPREVKEQARYLMAEFKAAIKKVDPLKLSRKAKSLGKQSALHKQLMKAGKYAQANVVLVEIVAMMKGAKKTGGLLSGLGKGLKAIANSKVMRIAAKGLALAAPLMGPLAPVALGASATIGVAGKLAGAASVAKEGIELAKATGIELPGAKPAAAAMTASAMQDALRIAQGSQAKALQIIKEANRKRKRAEAAAAKADKKKKRKGKKPPKAKAPKRGAAARKARKLAKHKRAPKADAVIMAAAKGRLRSNKPGKVTRATLRKAHRAGRVFWLAAG